MFNYKSVIFLAIVLFLLFFLFEQLVAQPSFPDDPDQIPIDGGLAILTGSGTLYAISKLRKSKDRLKDGK